MSKIAILVKNEFLCGKSLFDWTLLAAGLALQAAAVLAEFCAGETESAGLIVSGFCGVLSVILCSEGKISFYIFGFVQLLTYVFCFSIPNRLHGETIENAMYFVTMVYGVFAWARNYGRNRETGSIEIRARRLGPRGNAAAASAFVLGTTAYWLFLKNVPLFGSLDSDPFVDSITSVPAYIAQLLMVAGFREQYVYWLILDAGSIVLALRADSPVMTVQFAFWTFVCLYGFARWTRSAKSAEYCSVM